MKKDGILLFAKTLLQLHLELFFVFIINSMFSLLLVVIRFQVAYESHIFLILFYSFAFFSMLYLVFSNTIYGGISTKILRYKYETDRNRMLKISISNVILYCSYVLMMWMRYKQIGGWTNILLTFLVGLEFICFFIPPLNTRFSFWLLSIKMVSTKSKTIGNTDI